MAAPRAPKDRNGRQPDQRDDDLLVRQYRYLLATATVDALEAIHVEVLEGMTETERRQVLKSLAEAFATGGHLGPGEVSRIAHLVAAGAHRHPRAWTDSLDAASARQLAQAALDSEGYADPRFNQPGGIGGGG